MFNERLKLARKAKKLTQEELGAIMGVKKNTVCDWEKGKYSPDVEIIAPLARALEVPVTYLIEDEANTQNTEKPASSENEAGWDEYDAIVAALMEALRGNGRLVGDDLTEEQLITLKGIALILDASFRKL